MTQRDPHPTELFERCRDSVVRVTNRYDWRLLDQDEFVFRTVECLHSGEAGEPWAAAVNVYCRCLYLACRGDEGEERQERAFIELHRYLHDLSFREVADMPADLRLERINETLMRIWERLPRYHKPGAFLAIAAMELRNVLRPWWNRPSPGRAPSRADLAAQPLEAAEEQPDRAEGADPLALALTGELARRVRARLDDTLRRFPRARQQLEAVWLKHFVGLDDRTIAAYLGKSVASVHVLRSRGLRRLRDDPGWQDLGGELGL